LATPDNTGTLE